MSPKIRFLHVATESCALTRTPRGFYAKPPTVANPPLTRRSVIPMSSGRPRSTPLTHHGLKPRLFTPGAMTRENAKPVDFGVPPSRPRSPIVVPLRTPATQNPRILRLLVGTPTHAADPQNPPSLASSLAPKSPRSPSASPHPLQKNPHAASCIHR
jgi:hypothetical protein